MTQNERIIKFMKENGSISSLEAMTQLHIGRLASRIYDIKKMGIEISDRTEYGENEYGKYHYTRYSLA